MKKSNLLSIFLVIFITIIIGSNIYNYKIKKPSSNSSNQNNAPFFISNKTLYSGIIPQSKNFSKDGNWKLDISQYTDIAIYISTTDKNLTDTNTIKSLYLDEIKFAKFPKIGTPTLYYQNPLKFATDYISTEHSIETHLNYNILNFENEDNYNYYSSPNFFTDCSIPITLKFLNSEILKNYEMANSETLTFNGSILKKAKINLEDLNTTISFNINIVTNANQLYTNSITLEIPLKNQSNTLFDQNIYLKEDINSPFQLIEH